jgi:hypothetical protein
VCSHPIVTAASVLARPQYVIAKMAIATVYNSGSISRFPEGKLVSRTGFLSS